MGNKTEGMTCERCGDKMIVHTLSWFNKQTICLVCDSEELSHPSIKEAKKVEHEHVKRGDYNFRGVGLPSDLQEKYNCAAF